MLTATPIPARTPTEPDSAEHVWIRWDPDSGWAHLARRCSTTGTRTFAGFAYLGTDTEAVIIDKLTAAGLVVHSHEVADGLLELDMIHHDQTRTPPRWPEPELRH